LSLGTILFQEATYDEDYYEDEFPPTPPQSHGPGKAVYMADELDRIINDGIRVDPAFVVE